MNYSEIAYILITFGYVILFGILGAITLLLHVPKEKGLESYKMARKTLGTALTAISIFCIILLLIPQDHTVYLDFWTLLTFTLIHSWLTYASLLFLIESPRYVTRRFYIDGAVPAVLMISCGIAGILIPSVQSVMKLVFLLIFSVKCAYMFYVCITEYHKCKKELDNYYDENPDTSWIKNLIWLALFMSAATIVAFFIPRIHVIYYLSVPVIYSFIVFKTINFAPRKIDAVRKRNATLDKPEKKKKISQDIENKIGPMVEHWISLKKFCNPDMNIKDVAADMGTNHNYLSQYINNHLGMTFQVWLNTLRIEESKILLTDGNKRSIEEIGMLVGFSQVYNFSRWFRSLTGTTPLRYRKEL